MLKAAAADAAASASVSISPTGEATKDEQESTNSNTPILDSDACYEACKTTLAPKNGHFFFNLYEGGKVCSCSRECKEQVEVEVEVEGSADATAQVFETQAAGELKVRGIGKIALAFKLGEEKVTRGQQNTFAIRMQSKDQDLTYEDLGMRLYLPKGMTFLQSQASEYLPADESMTSIEGYDGHIVTWPHFAMAPGQERIFTARFLVGEDVEVEEKKDEGKGKEGIEFYGVFYQTSVTGEPHCEKVVGAATVGVWCVGVCVVCGCLCGVYV